LRNQGYISDWHSRKIGAGKEWQTEIDEHLNSARIILLLVSPDFMASDYCNDVEVKRALERHAAGKARVIPILLRRADWQNTPFSKLQVLPANGKPISSWSNIDEALYHVAQEIRHAIEQFPPLEEAKEAGALATSPVASPPAASTTTIAGVERPATALLSYAREDADAVRFLQLQLKVRGVRAWRDVTDLPLGGATEREIVQAIENEADTFVVYITPHSLASNFVWDIEIPAALQRQQRDPLFNVVPILQDVTYRQLQQQCAARGYRSLTDFNAERLPNSTGTEPHASAEGLLKSIANRILKASLKLRLHCVAADRTYEPWLVLRTFKDLPETPALDLDLDWWDVYQDRNHLPSAEEWRETLFPALQDVKNALVELPVSKKLHMSLHSILPAAFALGYIFPVPTRYTLLVEGKHGTWSNAGLADASPPFQRIAYSGEGDPHVAVIEIAVTSSTAYATTQYLEKSALSYRSHIRYELPGGPDYINGVKDAVHALAMAQYIGKELRLLCGQGVMHIHLFAAIPAALAVLLGHQFNALCPISLYQFVANTEYVPACTLTP
ncbi:MAG: SAVED domain-containing protein, partial [Ktedonobacteraceae bacterium]